MEEKIQDKKFKNFWTVFVKLIKKIIRKNLTLTVIPILIENLFLRFFVINLYYLAYF